MTSVLDGKNIDAETRKRVEAWLAGGYDEETKTEIRRMLEEDPQALVDAFYTNLDFGTGGLRGLMGVGTNRMNVYTVRSATQGLANYILRTVGTKTKPSVAIGYDSRRQSDVFAWEAARVLAGNGIKAYVYPELRPTPSVSFACRLKGCQAAIMITASHNPPEYNGYKVYWEDGAQILPPHDSGIIQEVRAIQSLDQIKITPKTDRLIEQLGSDVDGAYLAAIQKLQHYPKENAEHGADLKIVYTSLHGTGVTMVPKALQSWGFTSFSLVQAQASPDGNFPTVRSPNPEEQSALDLGIKQMISEDGDILMATDPDADRLGVVVMHKGAPEILNGNQLACICLHHVCEALCGQGKLPENAGFVKTIVTTELFRSIVEAYGKTCVDVLTGFKYVAEQIRLWEQQTNGLQYIFGGEESYGYLLGTDVRDKDAIGICTLVAEAALHAKRQGKTLLDILYAIYHEHGVYLEKLFSLNFPETKEGKAAMSKALERLRSTPPKEICGSRVVVQEDYLTQTRSFPTEGGRTEAITLPKSNVLLYRLEDGSKIAIRPSGTEPKVKIYVGAVNRSEGPVAARIPICDAHANFLIHMTRELLSAR